MRISVVVAACLIEAAVGALSLPVNDAAAAADPPCPNSWPGPGYDGPPQKADYGHIAYEDFFTASDGEQWFVIRSSDSNGYATVRAYPATDHGVGYVANSPDAVCYLLVLRPGDAEDTVTPLRVTFATEQEEPTPAPQVCAQPANVNQSYDAAQTLDIEIGRPGGSMTVASIYEPLTFNPAIADDVASISILSYLFEGLTTSSLCTGEAGPYLAQRWERSEDGLTWTFHLRRDVKWHDGTSFTAHDVKFTFDRIVVGRGLPEVTALDDHTVRFVLTLPSAAFLRNLDVAIYPKHILEPHVDAGVFSDVWDIDTDPSEVIGTGPFVIKSYLPGKSLTLARNPNYWLRDARGNQLPYLDEIRFLTVPDFAAKLAKFQAGETGVHELQPQEYATLKPLEAEGKFTIYERGPGFATRFLAFNMNPGQNDAGANYVAPERLEWFRTKEFRQAVAHTIDKARIIAEIQHGRGEPQWSSVSPAAGDFHNPNVRRYEYDIARANAILDDLGWTDIDEDGIREDGAGNDIAFTLATGDRCDACARFATIIREGLAAIGLTVTHQPIEAGLLVRQLTATYDWEAVIIGLTGGPDPGSGMNVWHSGGRLHLWHPNQVRPATAWEAEIDDLYVRASQEPDRAKRIAYYHRAQEVIAENVPFIYTTQGIRTTAVSNLLGNVTPTLFDLMDIRYVYRTDQ